MMIAPNTQPRFSPGMQQVPKRPTAIPESPDMLQPQVPFGGARPRPPAPTWPNPTPPRPAQPQQPKSPMLMPPMQQPPSAMPGSPASGAPAASPTGGGIRFDNPRPYFLPDGSINPIYSGSGGPAPYQPQTPIGGWTNSGVRAAGSPGDTTAGGAPQPWPTPDWRQLAAGMINPQFSMAPGGQNPGGSPQPPVPSPGSSLANQIMDPAPYNAAVGRGMGMLNSIPTSANSMLSASPAFAGMSSGLTNQLNSQMAQHGSGLQNQAGLEFSRKAGAEVPRMLLNQLMGLRGVENESLDLQNDFYRNDVQRQLGGILPILRLLGALGGSF